MSPRLFGQVLGIEVRRRMSYRVDFWLNSVAGFVVEFGIYFFLVHALFAGAGAETIGPYSRYAMLVYYAVVMLLARLVRGPEFAGGDVSEDVYEGGLNRYLVFPTSYFGFKYAQQLGALVPLLLQAVLFGVGFALLLPPAAGVAVTPLSLGMAAASLAIANLLYFLIRLPVQLVAFWADNVWSLTVAVRLTTSFLGGVMVPLALFPAWTRQTLDWLPFRFLFDVPVRAALGRLAPGEWLAATGVALAWCGVMAVVASLVWRRGNLRYTGVGI